MVMVAKFKPQLTFVSVYFLPFLLVVLVIGKVLIGDQLSVEMVALHYACATILTALVILPRVIAGSCGLWLWSLMSALIFCSVVLFHGFPPSSLLIVMRLTMAVFILVLLLSTFIVLLEQALGDCGRGRLVGYLVIGLTSLAPIWLGPVAGLSAGNKWVIEIVIVVSPVSYLGALAEVDYLRSDWFYRHTPFGGLRYDYPDPVLASMLIVGLLLVLFVVTNRLMRSKEVSRESVLKFEQSKLAKMQGDSEYEIIKTMG